MKNWKTTLAGLLAGGTVIMQALIDAYNAGAFDGKQGGQLAIGICVVILGIVCKDHNVTGGTKAQDTINNPPTL